MKSTITKHQTWCRALLLTAIMLAEALTLSAQNVIINPQTGKFIAALTTDTELGFQNGWSSLWRHEQLQLSLSVSDETSIDEGGEFTEPAGNLLKKDNEQFYIAGGRTRDCQIIVSLPEGYRITSYEIVLRNENNGKTVSGITCNSITKTFREMSPDFTTTIAEAKTADGRTLMSRNNETDDYIIKRTSTGKDDMGDHLYFQIHKTQEAYFAVTVKSFEIHFAADRDFTTSMAPTARITTAKSVVTAPFNIGTADLGPIQPRTKGQTTFYSYSYRNVKPLKASTILYQEDAISNGMATEGVADTNKITAVALSSDYIFKEPDYYFCLHSGVYYVESPTNVTSQNNITFPVGYRITGATLRCRKMNERSADYRVRLYSADATSYTEKTISSTADEEMKVSNMNNDAVKFEIIGTDEALVTIDITMQALSPYIKSTEIVCTDSDGNNVTNSFAASNFTVSGGFFQFYMPEESRGGWSFSFKDLMSDYADNTYFDGSGIGTSRYSFVKSAYWDTAEDLYLSDPNHTYTDKIAVADVGNNAFKFNNADELDNHSTSTETRYWTEYPFTIQNYLAQKPGNAFGPCSIASIDNPEVEAYLFTADETRYNIAPTTATQHRYYAYYKLNMELKQKTFMPIVEVTRVYDTTCHDKDGNDVEDAKYGIRLATEILDDGTMGYLRAEDIHNAIKEEMAAIGSSVDHVLYVDASSLKSVYHTSYIDNWMDEMGKNAIVYLPRYSTYNGRCNIATKTQAGSFTSCCNFILTDKQPFFAPYDIDLDAAHYVSYERKMTVVRTQEYGQSAIATIVLPFTLTLDSEGRHHNLDYNGKEINGITFSLKTLRTTDCMTYTDAPYGNRIDYAENYAHFMNYEESMTAANHPYMVAVDNAPDDAYTLFSAIQYGASIKATTGMNPVTYTYSGEDATGTLDTECVFTPMGTYAGIKLDRTGNYFYFAKNWFLNSQNIISSAYLYVHPFRAYCEYSGSTSARRFGIITGDDNIMPTDMEQQEDATRHDGLTLCAGQGCLQASSDTDTTIAIRHISGKAVMNVAIKGGVTRSISLPSGIYLVGSRKIIVK